MCLNCCARVAEENGFPLRLIAFPELGVSVPVDIVAVAAAPGGVVPLFPAPEDVLMVVAARSPEVLCIRCRAASYDGQLYTPESMAARAPEGLSRLVCQSCRPVAFSFAALPGADDLVSPRRRPARRSRGCDGAPVPKPKSRGAVPSRRGRYHRS